MMRASQFLAVGAASVLAGVVYHQYKPKKVQDTSPTTIAATAAIPVDSDGFMHVTDALKDAAVARSLSNPGRTVFLVTGDELTDSERVAARRLVGAHFDCAAPNGPTACFHVAPSERDARQSLAKWYRLPHFPSQLVLTDARFRENESKFVLPFGKIAVEKSGGRWPPNLDADLLKQWTARVSSPSAEPFKTSMPRPKGDRDPADPHVWRAVHDSFEDVVIRNSEDVLVDVYTPGCPSCGALMPRVHMAAKILADAGVAGVRIALFDGEGNDLPALHLPEREFPILKLFPSGAKDTPVSLAMLGTDGKKGLPTVLEIIEFVARNGKTKFSITDAMANAAVHAEAEAVVLQNMKFRIIRDVRAFESYASTGPEAVGLSERKFEETVDDCRDVLAEAYHALNDAIGGTTQQAAEKVQKAEAVMATAGLFAPVIGKHAQFIASPQQYMEVMEDAMASKQPVIVAYGNSALKTWETEGADVLRKLSDQPTPRDGKRIRIVHVDCAGQEDLCKLASAEATQPCVHFYRNGYFVSKVYWENADLIAANADALVRGLGK